MALRDALHSPRCGTRADTMGEARAYILEPNRDFTRFCFLAGIDLDVICERFMRQLA